MEIKRCYETIIGASVGENQLVQSGDTSVTVPNGHKYYAKINGTESLGASTGSTITINDSAKDMVVDLTQKLGSAIADYIYSLGSTNGISKLREWGFLRGYQAYNAGSIESVEVTEKKCVGFNQWDEEWELGYIVPSTGELNTRTDRIRSKNYIPVLGGNGYYFYTHGMIMNCVWYDASHNYIRNNSPNNEVVTTPQNAEYCKFSMPSDYGTTYNHDICINLSNPDRNGEYEAYAEQTYDYGTDVLNGIFKLDANNKLYADGDVKTSDGVITRKYGIVDLGTFNWVRNAYDAAGYFYFRSGTFLNWKTGSYPNFICSQYSNATSRLYMNDKTIAPYSVSHYDEIFVRDDAYTDAATFKTAMSGVMLVYELATPTTETSTPFTSPQIVYPDGTEEFVTENSVPVGHESKYQL